VEPELDAAGWLPGAEVWFGEIEVAVGVKAQGEVCLTKCTRAGV
jgi:hypothetical protein